MKYPKLWNNSSAVGESLVRSLQRIDTPFLSAHAPGVEANKMNRLSEVKSDGGDVFLSNGAAEGRGNIAVWSPDLKKPFTPSGEMPGGSGTLFKSGTKRALTWVFETSTLLALNSTLRGAKFREDVPVQLPSGSSASGTISAAPAGLYVFNGDRIRAYYLAYYMEENVGGVVTASFRVHVRNHSSQLYWITYSLTGVDVIRIDNFLIGPGELLQLIPVAVRRGDAPFPDQLDPRATRLARINLMTGGVQYIPAGDLTGLLRFSPNASYSLNSKNAMNGDIRLWSGSVDIVACPDGSVRAFADARYYDREYDAEGADIPYSGHAAAAFALTGGGFSRQPNIDLPNGFRLSDNWIVVGDRIVTIVREGPDAYYQSETLHDDRVPYDEYNGAAALVVMEMSGAYSIKPLPVSAKYAGILEAFDTKTILLPVFDGGDYFIMQSVDFGDTWSRRVTVRSEQPHPTSAAVIDYLPQFAYVIRTVAKGLPANPYPGSPWVYDSRKPKPWE